MQHEPDRLTQYQRDVLALSMLSPTQLARAIAYREAVEAEASAAGSLPSTHGQADSPL